MRRKRSHEEAKVPPEEVGRETQHRAPQSLRFLLEVPASQSIFNPRCWQTERCATRSLSRGSAVGAPGHCRRHQRSTGPPGSRGDAAGDPRGGPRRAERCGRVGSKAQRSDALPVQACVTPAASFPRAPTDVSSPAHLPRAPDPTRRNPGLGRESCMILATLDVRRVSWRYRSANPLGALAGDALDLAARLEVDLRERAVVANPAFGK